MLLAWLTYYGAALAAVKRAHIGFPGWSTRCRRALRVPAVLFGELCVIGFFALLAWYRLRWCCDPAAGDTLVSLPGCR